MKIITEVRDGKYLLGQFDHPFHYVGRLPAGPGRQSYDNNLAYPCLPAPEKQLSCPFLIFTGSVNAEEQIKEDSKMHYKNRRSCVPATDQQLTRGAVGFSSKGWNPTPPWSLHCCLFMTDAQHRPHWRLARFLLTGCVLCSALFLG